jgi:phage-related baseplate assembly protein
MPSLPTQSFTTIVTNTIAGIQGRASKFLNFSTGSSLRAIVEGFAGLFLWFQALVLQLLLAIRLSTSTGADVDTFTADFMPIVPGSQTTALPGGSPRLGAQAASGNVTFSRFTAAPATCFIAVGATVVTTDGTNTQFAVVANTSFATYSALLGGYTLASSVASITVPVQAVVAGAAGNVAAGAISSITSPIQGIDTVTNPAAFANGADQEQDSDLKKRFAAYILGLSRGDVFGLTASVEGAAVNVQFTLTEGYNYDGSYHPGFFFVVADDGSGSPSVDFMAAITAAAQAVRPLSVQCTVFPPAVLFANVSMQLTTLAGFDHNTVVAQVAALVAFNVNSLGLGNDLAWSILASWAYSVPGVKIVSNVVLNSATGDAASMSASRLTQDRALSIGYATIKSGVVTIS